MNNDKITADINEKGIAEWTKVDSQTGRDIWRPLGLLKKDDRRTSQSQPLHKITHTEIEGRKVPSGRDELLTIAMQCTIQLVFHTTTSSPHIGRNREPKRTTDEQHRKRHPNGKRGDHDSRSNQRGFRDTEGTPKLHAEKETNQGLQKQAKHRRIKMQGHQTE